MFSVSFRLLLFENIYQKIEVPSGDKILGIGRRFFFFIVTTYIKSKLVFLENNTEKSNKGRNN